MPLNTVLKAWHQDYRQCTKFIGNKKPFLNSFKEMGILQERPPIYVEVIISPYFFSITIHTTSLHHTTMKEWHGAVMQTTNRIVCPTIRRRDPVQSLQDVCTKNTLISMFQSMPSNLWKPIMISSMYLIWSFWMDMNPRWRWSKNQI